ncbi:MAG: UDP-4-amino-4-deoxy-L-arabinose aminotransferase [Deltaproteobacteria bacterium]|nr:UDP-4-amino-4-deoxy-L-arabinose aminotransferase [Deltaproteobacteria bacterium]
MRSEFLPFSRPSISQKEIDAVIEVLTSGWITTGKKSAQFEQKICDYTGCTSAVALCSATGGMHLLLKALDIGPGDEVITPSMTWVSTVNLIVLAGATPVFVDIDRETLMMNAESLEGKITPRTRLIIPVHFAGAAVDMDIIRQTVSGYPDQDIFIAEDAAHAMGTEYKGEPVGCKGTSIFSFHPIKNITTGEGGMFCSDDDKLLNRMRRLKFHGLGVDAYDRHTQSRAPQAQVLEPGYKYNMTDLAAALGLVQLSRIDAFNRKRAELVSLYLEKISGIHEILPLAVPSYEMKHSWHLFIVRLDIEKAGMDRDEFMQKLKDRNIGTGIHFRAVHLQKYYTEAMQTRRGMLPHTEWNSDRILSLPLFPDMTEKEVDSVIEAIKEVLS